MLITSDGIEPRLTWVQPVAPVRESWTGATNQNCGAFREAQKKNGRLVKSRPFGLGSVSARRGGRAKCAQLAAQSHQGADIQLSVPKPPW